MKFYSFWQNIWKNIYGSTDDEKKEPEVIVHQQKTCEDDFIICKICNNHVDEIVNHILAGKKSLSIRYCIYCGTMWVGTPLENKRNYISDKDQKNCGKSAIIFKGFFYIPVSSKATLEYINKKEIK